MSKQRDFYVPPVHAWNARLISETFHAIQVKRVLEEIRHVQSVLDIFDLDFLMASEEIKSKWSGASVQVMQAFELRLKGIRKERKRVDSILKKLVRAANELEDIAKERGWN
jgi:hypothetical protein